ncbi:MAG: YbjN domain-containing protein [Proteobacteria bacterium]|nr:YbjN domain-containing protein [Pseudomonadota bacterium]
MVFSFDVIVRGQTLVGIIDYEAEFDLVSFCLYLPFKYLSNRDQALEAVNRGNIGTRFGRFECVGDDFQLRYRRAVDLRARRVTLARLDQLVQAGRDIAESTLTEFASLAVAAIPA